MGLIAIAGAFRVPNRLGMIVGPFQRPVGLRSGRCTDAVVQPPIEQVPVATATTTSAAANQQVVRQTGKRFTIYALNSYVWHTDKTSNCVANLALPDPACTPGAILTRHKGYCVLATLNCLGTFQTAEEKVLRNTA